MGMNSIYPNAIDGYSQLPLIVDGATKIDASNINAIRSAIVNIENELGVNPKGDHDDLVARLEALDSSLIAIEALIDAIGEPEPSIIVSNVLTNEIIKASDSTGILFEGTGILVDALGNTSLPGNLSITGDFLTDNNAGITGDINIAGNADITGIITVTGNAILESGLDVSGSIDIDGTSTFNNNITVNLPNDTSELIIIGGSFKTGTRRYYGTKSIAPLVPVPASGDTYFDSVFNAEMYWDAIRSKWLSVQTFYFDFGRNGIVPKGGFFRSTDGKAMSATVGHYERYNGTITSITITRDAPLVNPYNIFYTVYGNGVLIDELQLLNINTYGVADLNSNFTNAGSGVVLSVGINAISPNDSTTGTLGRVYYKLRK